MHAFTQQRHAWSVMRCDDRWCDCGQLVLLAARAVAAVKLGRLSKLQGSNHDVDARSALRMGLHICIALLAIHAFDSRSSHQLAMHAPMSPCLCTVSLQKQQQCCVNWMLALACMPSNKTWYGGTYCRLAVQQCAVCVARQRAVGRSNGLQRRRSRRRTFLHACLGQRKVLLAS